MSVWTPFPPAELGPLPDAVQPLVFDGGEPPGEPAEVELYVLPYDAGAPALAPLRSMRRLRVLQTLTAGVDSVLPYVGPDVTLCSARGVHDAATSEFAVALVLASLRGLPGFVRAQDRQEWAHEHLDALADRRVLVLGAGSIGRAVASRLAPFECAVTLVATRARDGISGVDELPALLPHTDVVILTVPLTDATRGLVDAEFLAALPDRALLVNVARGPVVDTGALLAELSRGRLRAALDVTDPEPPPPGHPLWTAPGVLITPHVAGGTSAFRPRALALVRDQLTRWAAGQPLRNVVQGPGAPVSTAPRRSGAGRARPGAGAAPREA